jgi:hypothetical protein
MMQSETYVSLIFGHQSLHTERANGRTPWLSFPLTSCGTHTLQACENSCSSTQTMALLCLRKPWQH